MRQSNDLGPGENAWNRHYTRRSFLKASGVVLGAGSAVGALSKIASAQAATPAKTAAAAKSLPAGLPSSLPMTLGAL